MALPVRKSVRQPVSQRSWVTGRAERRPQISLSDPGKPGAVAHGETPVETELVPHRLDFLRAQALHVDVHRDRVAGRQAQKGEHPEGDDEQKPSAPDRFLKDGRSDSPEHAGKATDRSQPARRPSTSKEV